MATDPFILTHVFNQAVNNGGPLKNQELPTSPALRPARTFIGGFIAQYILRPLLQPGQLVCGEDKDRTQM